ncbi:ion transporter [Marivirga sp. S37H4]|uniref:Ion transporter n=1 Tax=Marivirga aurantiaca TaxID=2802615 RepID=A0A935C8Z2_9BACT|nr:ion transporter [Marivirga aurantiaca]MBK6265765.1 ion transporter [Marivirga aurantiaca]
MIKTKIYRAVEKGSHGRRMNVVFDYIIMSLILLSVISIILESVPEINSKFGYQLRIFNIFSIVVFSIEYLMRLYVSDLTHPSTTRFKSYLKFMFSLQGLIDLMALIPFYLPMLIKIDLRFLRVLRLTRFLRVLKVNRYNNSLNLIGAVIKEKKPELLVTGFVTFLVLLFASFIMYYVEGEKQPEAFPNILATFWWAIATLTTVGYGDVYPVTGWGKFISGIIAILGIGIVALPTGLISAGFMDKIGKTKQSNECPHCGKDIENRIP